MYPLVLALHNLIRWIALAAALWAVIRACAGWLRKRGWSRADRLAGLVFTTLLDVELLVGLLLYFVYSPLTRGTPGGAESLRYFTLVHPLGMLLAVVVAHAGSVLARRAPDGLVGQRRAAQFYALALLALVLSMPWTRPLLPVWP